MQNIKIDNINYYNFFLQNLNNMIFIIIKYKDIHKYSIKLHI